MFGALQRCILLVQVYCKIIFNAALLMHIIAFAILAIHKMLSIVLKAKEDSFERFYL